MGKQMAPLDALSDRNRIAEIESTRPSTTRLDSTDDDLLSVLAKATENVRAQQVFAWEQIRRQSQYRAAGSHFW
ncbi:MAG: hypothetical protein HY774_02485 [Acidobacteria bacterium]|nr:hypothetical protein [Acidobacteriota bacterium]